MRFSSLCYVALAASLAFGCAGAKKEGGGGGGGISGGGARGGSTGGGARGGNIGAGAISGTWTPVEFPWTDPTVTNTPNYDLPEDSASAFSLMYPLDGSMQPKSIRQITFHWLQSNTSFETFRIRFEGNGLTRDMFVPCCSSAFAGCEPKCQYQMDDKAWLTLAHEMAASPPVPVTVTVTGSTGSKIASSQPISIYFTPEALVGGLYYWSTALPGIYRMNIQSDKAEPFVAQNAGSGRPGTETNDLWCAGCHSVSRDGSTIAWTAADIDCESYGQLAVADTANPNSKIVAPSGTINATLPALSSDGSWAAVTYDDPTNRTLIYKETNPKRFALWNMTRDDKGVRQPASVANEYITGTAASDGLFGAGRFPSYPEWSPIWDAASNTGKIAVSLGKIGNWPASYGAATLQVSDIAVLDFVDGAITQMTTLVKSGERCMNQSDDCFHAFPTWSPDGAWLAFVTFTKGSPQNANGMDYYKTAGNPDGVLRLVKVENPATMYNLWAATQLPNNTVSPSVVGVSATWPKFSPFSMSNGDIMFLTFSSKHDYGWPLQQQSKKYGQCLDATTGKSCPPVAACQIPQLWMAGIQLSKAATSPNGDPSYAPLWLPYQETNQWNHLAYWSESITCLADAPSPDMACGQNLTCVDGKCLSTLPIP